MRKSYFIPKMTVSKSRLRASLLAGSEGQPGTGEEGGSSHQYINWDRDVKVDTFD